MIKESKWDKCSCCGKEEFVANKGSYYGLCGRCIINKDTSVFILDCMRVKKEKT